LVTRLARPRATGIAWNTRCDPTLNLTVRPLGYTRMEGGTATVGFSFGSGVERPVVAGPGSTRATGTIGCATGAIGSVTMVTRDG